MKNVLLGMLLAISPMVYSQETEFFTTYGEMLNGEEEFTIIKVFRSSEDGESWELLTLKEVIGFHNITLPCDQLHLLSFRNGDVVKFLYIHNFEEGVYPINVNFDNNNSAVIYKDETGYRHASGTEEELFVQPVDM